MEKISKEDKSIVIGGGIAGLLASRVLSEHFGNVVLIPPPNLSYDHGNTAAINQLKMISSKYW
jgi:glycine/D-amino acid oxidase-like deaminating enzyme